MLSANLQTHENALRSLYQRHRKIEKTRRRLKKERRNVDADMVKHLAALLDADAVSRSNCRTPIAYATKHLGLSRAIARRRLPAARVAQRFPIVVDHLRGGRISLAVVELIEPHLQVPGLLDAVLGATTTEVEELLGRLSDVASPKTEPAQISSNAGASSKALLWGLPGFSTEASGRIIAKLRMVAALANDEEDVLSRVSEVLDQVVDDLVDASIDEANEEVRPNNCRGTHMPAIKKAARSEISARLGPVPLHGTARFYRRIDLEPAKAMAEQRRMARFDAQCTLDYREAVVEDSLSKVCAEVEHLIARAAAEAAAKMRSNATIPPHLCPGIDPGD